MRDHARRVNKSRNTWPPPAPLDETNDERQFRKEEEKKAQERSDAIDRVIASDKQEMRERKPNTKILLLGQTESGKSTILKNMQLLFAPKSFYAETETWKAVIHLNLVRTVNFVLNLLEDHFDPSSEFTKGPPQSPLVAGGKNSYDNIRFLKIRLAPLRHVEHLLSRRFCSLDLPPPLLRTFESDRRTHLRYDRDRASEISVRSGWKAVMKLGRPSRSSKRPNSSRLSTPRDDIGDSQRVIEACKEDMIALWEDPVVQRILKTQKVCLQAQSGFFLSDVSRIAAKNYMPTPADILRARLQTIGVEEHRIKVEIGAERGNEWLIYDVGGGRGQRPVWAPFVDDVNVVMFLAPISVFNESLPENKKMNRLMDSFALWRQICGNKLLRSAHFVVLLNKCDLLDEKLKAGTRFCKYVTSYGCSQPNDLAHVSEYLKGKFVSIHNQLTPANSRKLYTHMTCATDHQATSIVLNHIQEAILFNAFACTDIL